MVTAEVKAAVDDRQAVYKEMMEVLRPPPSLVHQQLDALVASPDVQAASLNNAIVAAHEAGYDTRELLPDPNEPHQPTKDLLSFLMLKQVVQLCSLQQAGINRASSASRICFCCARIAPMISALI